uniref:Uncharacterized protein n=1 Tax=Cyprinus carpio TaxID=7962 RepID=A0A8C2L251_CYPCA
MGDREFIESSFQLSVDYEQNYTLKNPACIAHEMCVFNITVSGCPLLRVCVHSVFFHHYEEGVSLFYICFSSFIVVGLFIMSTAVIVTNIRIKVKGLPQKA